jgi:hypothetical protein
MLEQGAGALTIILHRVATFNSKQVELTRVRRDLVILLGHHGQVKGRVGNVDVQCCSPAACACGVTGVAPLQVSVQQTDDAV